LPDRQAEDHGLIRVADEEDEALYPADYFVPIDLPKDVEDAIESAVDVEARHR
jgi:hypothetical protein